MSTQAFVDAIKSLPVKKEIIDRLVSDIQTNGLEDEAVQEQLLKIFDDLAMMLVLIDQTETARAQLRQQFNEQVDRVDRELEEQLKEVEVEFKQSLEKLDLDTARDMIQSS